MSDIIDQTNDPGFSVLRTICDQFPQVREMSKTAELDPEVLAELPDAAFAWPGRRQFPIHNREHTILSLGYRKHASAVPADVDARLTKAAEVYGVVNSVFETPIAIEKQASPEYWLIPEKKRFLVKEAADVPVAEKVVLERFKELPFEDRATAAQNLVKVAQHFGVELSPSTHKLAGFTVTSTQMLRDYIGARREAAIKLGSTISDAYRELDVGLSGMNPFFSDAKQQTKIAKTLYELDHQSGVEKLYGSKVPDPMLSVFNTTKIAASQVNLNGELFDKIKLASLPATFWQDALGEDVAKEVTSDGVVDAEKLAQVLSTLPQDLKTTLVTQLTPYK